MRGPFFFSLVVNFIVPTLALDAATPPPADRSKLPENARNLPLQRLSSGALMLLNSNNNLVTPPAVQTTAKGGTITRAAETAVTLDLRVGPNISLGPDPPQLPANQRAQAEPFIARSGVEEDFIVAVFQEGRFATSGGAVDCGYSVTHDGGLNWTRALIPNLTQASGGPYFRATDPVVAFDANNNVYLETLAATDPNFVNGAIVISKSTDGGASFGPPMVAYQPSDNTIFPDKEWFAINTYTNTPTAGRIVVTFTRFLNANQNIHPIVSTFSDNGGATWSPIIFINGTDSALQGSQPLFLPNGNLVIVYWNFGSSVSPGERLESVISTDGGGSYGPPHLIAFGTEYNEISIRSGSFLPSAAVDPISGGIYVVYQSRFNGVAAILFTKSTDGGNTWTTPIPISDNPGTGVFNPAVNVAPGGRTVTAAFYDHRDNPTSSTLVNIYLAQSFDGGASWQPNIRLTSVSTEAALAPLTSEGFMLGDYLGIAQSTRPTVPAVPVWVDTRTGNPDPFVTRTGIAPYSDLATAWQAAHDSLAQLPATSLRDESTDPDRDGEENQAEAATMTNPLDPGSVIRTGKELNISTRLHIATGDEAGIAGFIVRGSSPKRVLIRALGPSLAAFGVNGVLQDPQIQLVDSNHNPVATNDNWRDSQEAAIASTGFAPADNRESAIVQTLDPGSYTAIVTGVNNSTGAALVEVYDLDPASSAVLANLSTRGSVQTGDDVMIAGFIVGGGAGANSDGSSQVLVRALGPELTGFGLSNVLFDPTLELHDANGNLIASNDNWKESQQAAIQATGLAPADDREAAILSTLIQGNWTAVVQGKNNTTGIALVEVYRIQ